MRNTRIRVVTGGGGRAPRRRAIAVGVAFAVVLATVLAAGLASIAPTGSAPGASPPATPDPSSPGVPTGSDLHESDPLLYQTNGRYFLYTSGDPGSRPINVPVASATTFGTWTRPTEALPSLPTWATPGFTWAPDIHRFGSTYVLYFTALVKGSSPPMQCVGASTGKTPTGPFIPKSKRFICQVRQGGTIDPRVFTDTDGTRWMLFKSDQNIGGANTPTKMWSQRLTSDGLGLLGRPSELMGPDEPWQGTIVEAPDMVKVGGTYWVAYSGNWFNQRAYAIGMARCNGPAGPCADVSSVPLLASNAQGAGPGEASLYQDRSGVWLLYSPSRSLAPKPDGPRPVYMTKLGFGPAGPYLAAGGPPPDLGPPSSGARPGA
jgi:GH43 family beta-xylosidase